jgi:MoCo/4Fe-4S cofactor protein with predicted Tat translocation signal
MIELPIVDARSSESEAPSSIRHWRSFGHLRNDPAFRQMVRDEFMPGADEAPSGASRRQFLQVMGASLALAGLTACRRPEEKILPYSQKPEEIIPGVPLYYATAMPFRGIVRGLLVESHEGRPTKIEGNPQHPTSLGTTSPFEQASILDLYDPDRSRRVLQGGNPSSLAEFQTFCQQFAADGAARRLLVIAGENHSPALAGLRQQLQSRYPQLSWITYTPEGDDPVAFGTQAAFGRPLRPVYRFGKDSVILSLDADFLSPVERNFVINTREFANSRDVENQQDGMSRLYVVESSFTMTGAKADHRLRLRASDVASFAMAVAQRLGVGGAAAANNPFANHPYVAAIAADLQQAGSRAVVIAGDTQPAGVHALAAAINGALGSTGVQYYDAGEQTRTVQADAIRQAVSAMGAGQVDAVLTLGTNPVYDAPGELNFTQAFEQVPVRIHVGPHVDESAQRSTWHVPQAHFLEAWGDGRAYDGTLSVIQPLIAPLYADALSEIEVVNLLATGNYFSGYDLVREHWRTEGALAGNFEEAWNRAVHDGFVPNTAYPTTSGGAGGSLPQLQVADPEALEVVFRLDSKVLDGRYANNAWLQEMPEQTTKVSWGNVARISPATAERLGLEVEYDAGRFYADVIEIAAGDRTVELPVWIVPGHPDNSITVTFGYGRNIQSPREARESPFWDRDDWTDVYASGPLANEVGSNVSPLRTAAFERILVGVNVRQVGDGFLVATTQEHGVMEDRPIVREATLADFRQNPDFANDMVEPLAGQEPWDEYPTLWQEQHPQGDPAFKDNIYYKHQWGMSIDMNRCTGCSACVIACQSENNVPVVGKESLAYGREMLWLRVDRYFVGEEGNESPGMVFQPMFCVHCENAPCEPVCPVYATTHSPDGISEMTYNRCIGTRYCSNNCPYKVRRFNFFNWTKTIPAEIQMQMNPNVTVRFRGVMEKCTYCVQRVREVNRREVVEQRAMVDGEVQTACQQACPADAIVFGDVSDPTTKVSQEKQKVRNYDLLAELNVKPRTSYQSVVRNVNPALAEAVV